MTEPVDPAEGGNEESEDGVDPASGGVEEPPEPTVEDDELLDRLWTNTDNLEDLFASGSDEDSPEEE